MKKGLRILALALAVVFILSLAACSNANTPSGNGGATSSGGNTEPQAQEPYKLSVFLCDFVTTGPYDPTSPVFQEINRLTNCEVEWIWAANSEYDELVSVTLASNELPTIMLQKNMSNMAIPNAIRAGAFWEIGPYLSEFTNLSQVNPITMNNISIDGKQYGIYRIRDLGRLGIGIRKDWMEKFGVPTTTDEFYDLMLNFTHDDPDGNGENDTWGINFCVYTGSLDVVSIWFDAPNKWGFDSDGKLIPAHLTDGYFESMKWLKGLYDEGAINQDFAVLPTDKWNEALRLGYAGVRIDTMDDTNGYQTWMVNNADRDPDDIVWTSIPTLKGPDGKERSYPTSGHAGYYVISKQATNNSVDELRRALGFLDRCNDMDVQLLTEAGILDLTYWLDENGYRISTPPEQAAIVDKLFHNLSQFTMGIPVKLSVAPVPSVVRDDYYRSRDYNESSGILVPNPCEPLLSKTASEQGNQLAKIYEDARIQYICGQITEAGWKDALDQWLKQGGQAIIDETQVLYDALPKD